MFTQRLIHLTLTSITTLALCYSATGGELLPTLMLAIPLGVVTKTQISELPRIFVPGYQRRLAQAGHQR